MRCPVLLVLDLYLSLNQRAIRYRVNDPKFRASRWGKTFDGGFDALKQHVQKRHAALGKTGAFPAMKPKQNVQLEPVSWDMPYESALARTDRAIVFVVPWLYVGG